MEKVLDHFVWSKIGDDGGESINGILARKEAERRLGTFWWGIGSSLNRDKLRKAVESCGGILPVLFSKQLTKPKPNNLKDDMWLWTLYEVEDVNKNKIRFKIPDHTLVVSPAGKRYYYALVCTSDNSIASLRDQRFDDQLFQNFPDGVPPGSSQNTALLTGHLQTNHSKGRYKEGFVAKLVKPWLVTLAEPRILTLHEKNLIAGWNGIDYLGLVRCIRG